MSIRRADATRSVFFITVLLVACSHARADDAARRDRAAVPAHTSTPTDSPRAQPVAATASTGAAATESFRRTYSLIDHTERSETFDGETLVIDFGVEGDAKYTLGGWQSTDGEHATIERTSVFAVQGTSVRLALPFEREGATRLAIRARGASNDRLRVFVNGREAGGGEIAGSEFRTINVTVPSGSARRGENQIILRVSQNGALAPRIRGGLAIDWIRIGPASAPEGTTVAAERAGADHTLAVLAGWTRSYTFEVPEHGALRGAAIGAAGSTLDIALDRDGAATTTTSIVPSASGTSFTVDLGPHAGSIVRARFTARDGQVSLRAPEVVARTRGVLAENARPARNAVVYLIDTLRADKLRPINPRSRVRTPGLDRFVATASTFLRAHTQENWTKPSVATLLSSLLPWQHTATTTEAVLPESVNTLPEILGARGHHTGAFIANGYVSDRFGFRQGWSTYRNYVREGRRSPAQFVAADVLAWLDARPADRPFFLYVHTIDPHVPYRPPASFLSMYDAAAYSGPVDFTNDNELLEKVKAGRVRLDARDREHLAALYDGEISYHDTHFNSIIDGLTRRGLDDDTIVIITADHGEEFWDHGSVGHGHSVYEELLHIPMFVRLPGQTNAVRVDAPVGLVDILPTILDSMGVPIPSDVAGHSMLPLLRREGTSAPPVTVSGFMDGWRTVVVGRYKLIHRTVDRMFVYDLDADPGETRDLAGTHPLALRYLRAMLGLSLAGEVVDTPSSARPASTRARPRPTTHQAETTEIDAETESQLRALGYVGSSRR